MSAIGEPAFWSIFLESDNIAEVSEEQHVLIGDIVNEALELGGECPQKTQLAIAAVNEKYHHAFDEQHRVLLEGIKDLKEGRKVVYYNYNTNCQVFTGPISKSEFKK